MAKSLRWMSKLRRETPNTTTTVDLPPELWLEILSYLPRIYLWKLMHVSRTLYAVALPEIFRELNLAYDDYPAMWHLYNWRK